MELNSDVHNTFYQLSKIRHLLVIREGEESQEDNSKIISDENFSETWFWIFKIFVLDFRFSSHSNFIKCLNSQTWQTRWTTKIMCGRWQFDQKLKIWTWLHMMRFSFRIMKKHVSFDYEMSFMRFGWKCDFAIRGGKVSPMEFNERKSFDVDGNNALCLRKK